MNRLKAIACGWMILATGMGSTIGRAGADTADYAVRAVLPQNQMNEQVSYFDLKVVPGQSQILCVVVHNRGNEEIEVEMEANTAFSNSNGLIEYSHTDTRDPSLQADFAKMVIPVEPVITVPANGQMEAEFMLMVPYEPFEGDVLGGLMFTKLDRAMIKEASDTAIQSVYQYVIGVRLRESEEPVKPLFELIGVEECQFRKPSLLLHLRNPRPVIASGMTLDVRIYPQGSAKATRTFLRGDLAMAPNSTMSYVLRLSERDRLQPGAYRVSVDLYHDEDTWSFEIPLIVQ